MIFNYPPSPKSIPPDLTRVSKAYKKGVRSSLWGLVVFCVLYISLIAINIWGIIKVADLGMHNILPDLLVLFFIVLLLVTLGLQINFLIWKKEEKQSLDVEVTAEDQPELFEFIKKLCVEIGTPLPGKVIISGRNNACVFQSTGFWSLIIPPKKNLEIGLALVLAIDVAEFKAMLAHELGHFSQSSTRLGRYIYSVNGVVGRMAFSRELREGFNQFARMNVIFYAIARLAFEFGKIQRSLFVNVYTSINRSYMRLSREMEFHADLVAASVSGSRPIVSGLKKIEFSAECAALFDHYVNKYRTVEKKDPENYFGLFQKFSAFLARHNKIAVATNGQIDSEKLTPGASSVHKKLVFENLWESHPSLEDRKKNVMTRFVESPADDTPAISVFRNWEKLSMEITKRMRQKSEKNTREKLPIVSVNECEAKLEEIYRNEFIPERFCGIYKVRHISSLDFSELCQQDFLPEEFNSVVGLQEKDLASRLNCLHEDMEQIIAIGNKQLDVILFEYDNVQFSWQDASELVEELEKKYDEYIGTLREKDKEIFLYHYKLAGRTEKSLAEKLLARCAFYQQVADLRTNMNEVYKILSPAMIEVHKRQTLLREEQAEFMPYYSKAVEKFRFSIDQVKSMDYPPVIGNVQLENGLIAYVWDGEFPDPMFKAFKFEMMMGFWKKLIAALNKLHALHGEQHYSIINLYEEIYNKNPTLKS